MNDDLLAGTGRGLKTHSVFTQVLVLKAELFETATGLVREVRAEGIALADPTDSFAEANLL